MSHLITLKSGLVRLMLNVEVILIIIRIISATFRFVMLYSFI